MTVRHGLRWNYHASRSGVASYMLKALIAAGFGVLVSGKLIYATEVSSDDSIL